MNYQHILSRTEVRDGRLIISKAQIDSISLVWFEKHSGQRISLYNSDGSLIRKSILISPSKGNSWRISCGSAEIVQKLNPGDKIILKERSDGNLEISTFDWLKGNLPQNFTLKTQERINIGENIYFQTDLILYDTTDSKPKYILDTKYKNPKHSSHEDIAQVVTYAVSKDCPETVLVYPTELNHSLDKYLGKIRVRNLTFSLDDKIEDAGNTFLTKLFS
jgi:McrBC 5-methylcytosine restriction system component